ncbi:polyamine ABC transporter substrate-binding protein [Cryptosporangium aurantiacum]|uniref:Spermidine/putrescine transport system substrate-binding protein n=1 Tax=Cryptosporangium aurantiacum TaxID=134849 RepID=A0A1M7I0B8_9ACTN|nr:spermidine/putrescine ABC transporter substrate-binding protein [Cryptosporangium aurantiacum]SHM33827.1 spermidine/putrescine transport system substrate-binding protein [Cryptosporangium aurantiacum]
MTDVDPDVIRSLRQLLSRRSVLRSAGAAGLLAAGGPLLAACGTEGASKTEAEQAATDLSDKDKVINFSNWPLYIDVDENDEKVHPTLAEFTKQTQIKVNYVEDINDNDQFFGKVRADLAAGNDIKRDVMVLTDWMAARLIRLKWVQRLDPKNVPNRKNIEPSLTEVEFDAKREYSLPWAGIMAGIAYNEDVTGPVNSITDLLTRNELRGKVTALTEMRDTMGLILLENGNDPASVTDAQFDEALATLESAVKSGQIRRFTGNDYTQDLAAGNVAACIAWSGDIVQLQAENNKIKFVTPEAGATRANDNMLIPNKAAHKKNAELLMNYYYEPAVAAELAAYVNYICPVVGAKEILEKSAPDVAKNELIFPSDATLAKLHTFKPLDDASERSYADKFAKVIGA